MDLSILYLIALIILIILAISDLIIGVSNDAVNFLNSALGSKAFNFKIIMTVAAVGILAGASFSSGMMEVARKGIFHPQYFYFSEIILLFLAVMITDIILLDLFNTVGMPTSTTVSIVFELLGAAVGLALIKVMNDPTHLPFNEYINSGKAMVIIFGILLSVVIAFTAGVFFQYISRLLFSFNYKNRLKYFGALWGGLAITAITYFILVKGAKGASFMSSDMKLYIKDNAVTIILFTFIIWTIILQLIQFFTKFDILKLVVLFGTFGLAMAFSGNDLVNFIGVPLAGFEAYKVWLASGEAHDALLMIGLSGKVATPTVFLILAGLIMAATLYFSKKARSVTETEISLGRQEEGNERFGSSALSRSLVRTTSKFSKLINSIIPVNIQNKIDKQFDRTDFQAKQTALGKNAPAFDLVRASVILSVASILISIATFFKLPLSTTYVTFMVAMGASLADGAWGRESAVYRITGVMSVIGGWFLTAFLAFTSAFILVFIFHYGGFYAIFAIFGIAIYIVVKTHILHKQKRIEKEIEEEEVVLSEYNKNDIIEKNIKNTKKIFSEITTSLNNTIQGLSHENLDLLNKSYKNIIKLDNKSKILQNKISRVVNKIEENDVDSGNYYAVSLYYLTEIVQSTKSIVEKSLTHVNNSHKPILDLQIKELQELLTNIKEMYNRFSVNSHEINSEDNLDLPQEIIKQLRVLRKKQIKRIKTKSVGTRNSILYLSILDHIRSIVNFSEKLEYIHLMFLENKNEDVV